MQAKRSVSAWVLVVLLLAPLPLMVGYLHLQQRAVKKAVKRTLMAGVPDDELVLLRFSHTEAETQLRWEHSREFEFDGDMYDIVRKEETADSVSYWCWNDHEETVLNRRVQRLAAVAWGSHPERRQHEDRLIQLLRQLDLPSEAPRLLIHPDNYPVTATGQLNLSYSEPGHAIPVPPPEGV